MPSNRETLFQGHICAFLKDTQQYVELTADDLHDREYHFTEKHLTGFVRLPKKQNL